MIFNRAKRKEKKDNLFQKQYFFSFLLLQTLKKIHNPKKSRKTIHWNHHKKKKKKKPRVILYLVPAGPTSKSIFIYMDCLWWLFLSTFGVSTASTNIAWFVYVCACAFSFVRMLLRTWYGDYQIIIYVSASLFLIIIIRIILMMMTI